MWCGVCGVMCVICEAAGATLVQWNRVNSNFLASAHDSDIRIWDKRVSREGERHMTM